MSIARSLLGAATTVVLIATLPIVVHAQETARTACKDGKTTVSTGKFACFGHGGVDEGKTAVLRRRPSATSSQAPARVTQAGSPSRTAAPKTEKPRYEEHRGWRWHRSHDAPNHEEKHERRYRCRDGKYETVHGKAKGKELCKHHGGLAR